MAESNETRPVWTPKAHDFERWSRGDHEIVILEPCDRIAAMKAMIAGLFSSGAAKDVAWMVGDGPGIVIRFANEFKQVGEKK